MTDKPSASISDHFGSLEDPRIDRTKRHALLDIIVSALCAVICGADGWVEVELFGNSHWGIENALHWVLDIAFNEDHRRSPARTQRQWTGEVRCPPAHCPQPAQTGEDGQGRHPGQASQGWLGRALLAQSTLWPGQLRCNCPSFMMQEFQMQTGRYLCD
jgi:hypothetical protein